MNQKNSHIIKFKKVNKVHDNESFILSDINLKINKGEFVAVIGDDNSSKETLIKSMNSLVGLTSGKLYVDGYNITKWTTKKKMKKINKSVGVIFQKNNLNSDLTVIKNVLDSFGSRIPLYRQILGIYTKKQKEAALGALAAANILKMAYIKVEELTDAEKQSVLLAKALIQNPNIILADEPIGVIDEIYDKETSDKKTSDKETPDKKTSDKKTSDKKTSDKETPDKKTSDKFIMDDFKKINETNKTTVIANLHSIDLALKYATRIIGLKNGEVVFDDKPKQISYGILKNIYGEKISEINIKKILKDNDLENDLDINAMSFLSFGSLGSFGSELYESNEFKTTTSKTFINEKATNGNKVKKTKPIKTQKTTKTKPIKIQKTTKTKPIKIQKITKIKPIKIQKTTTTKTTSTTNLTNSKDVKKIVKNQLSKKAPKNIKNININKQDRTSWLDFFDDFVEPFEPRNKNEWNKDKWK